MWQHSSEKPKQSTDPKLAEGPKFKASVACSTHYMLSSQSETLVCCCTGGYADLVAQLQSNVAFRQEQAAREIQGLEANYEANRKAIVAAGAVPALVALLKSDRPAAQCAGLTSTRQQEKAQHHLPQAAQWRCASADYVIEGKTSLQCKRQQ